MILSSTTAAQAPQFASACWSTQRHYAQRHGREFVSRSVPRARGDFEHRLPLMAEYSGHCKAMLYLEWDVIAEPDAGDLFEMLGDNDIMLPPFLPASPQLRPMTAVGGGLKPGCPALAIPWHIIGVMLVRSEIIGELERIRRHCQPYARNMPTLAAAYECTVLMAIQRGGFKLGSFPNFVHGFWPGHAPTWFLHFEGRSKPNIINHVSQHQQA